VRQFDIAAMFVSLWLLVAMIVDAATPRELTFYMIAAVTAPAVAVLALLYWRGIPKQDFAIVFATLWLIVAIVLEFVSPKPLPPLAAVLAGAPLVIVGCAIYFLRWRRSRRRPKATPL
jgi:peptidoglycan/LPS O-acetylase OafA/YrhL